MRMQRSRHGAFPAKYYKYLYDENADLFTNTEVEDIVLDNLFKEDEEDE